MEKLKPEEQKLSKTVGVSNKNSSCKDQPLPKFKFVSVESPVKLVGVSLTQCLMASPLWGISVGCLEKYPVVGSFAILGMAWFQWFMIVSYIQSTRHKFVYLKDKKTILKNRLEKGRSIADD